MTKPEPETAEELVWPKKFVYVTSVVTPTTCLLAISFISAQLRLSEELPEELAAIGALDELTTGVSEGSAFTLSSSAVILLFRRLSAIAPPQRPPSSAHTSAMQANLR